MSLIRKALWPTAIALGFLVFLGAIGQGNVVKQASAASGDICDIFTTAEFVDGTATMTEDSTELFVALIEDFDDADVWDASVDLDDGGTAGDSDITSRAVEDDDEWDYDDSINTDFLDEVGIIDPDDDTGDLEDALDIAFPDWDADLEDEDGNSAPAIGDNVCGDSDEDILDAIRDDVDLFTEAGIEDGENCWVGNDPPGSDGNDATDCQAAAPEDTGPNETTTPSTPNDGSPAGVDNGVNDDDIDCGYAVNAGGPCSISVSGMAAAGDAIAEAIFDGIDDCDDLGQIGEQAYIFEHPGGEFVGAQIHDYV